MRGLLRLVSPIIGFTFRADSDLVPVRFTIDAVKPAISSTAPSAAVESSSADDQH